MVRHWLRHRGPRFRTKLFFNALGAVATAIALVIIVAAKFKEGAWMTVIVVPGTVLLLYKINRHYTYIGRRVRRPGNFRTAELRKPAVIIPINSWDRMAEKAMRFGLMLSDDITAIHVRTEHDDDDRLIDLWKKNVEAPAERTHGPVPRLEILDSPYRRVAHRILDFVNGVAKQKPDHPIAVVIPERVEQHWYQYLLRRFRAARLRTLLFREGPSNVVVINTPYHLRNGR
jgi:hypothetical protein